VAQVARCAVLHVTSIHVSNDSEFIQNSLTVSLARSLLTVVLQVMYPTLTNSPLQKQTATAATRRSHTASLKPKQRTHFSPDVAPAAMFQKDAGFSAAEMASHVSVWRALHFTIEYACCCQLCSLRSQWLH
jgi:CBS-domain-containing membrane protein